jgi:UDP-N-acetylmuramate--alanine ligase
VRVIDDYAHHPTEIVATLQALRESWPESRVIAVFQPHRYSRVAALLDPFCRAFNLADVVIACDVYAAGEAPVEGIDGARLAEGIRAHGHRSVELAGPVEAAAQRAASLARPGDIVVLLGAGDVSRHAETVLHALAAAQPAPAPEAAP